ncbi:hypothetical protein M514_27828 [Trichuris suis]|uniref:C2H2-type domain-containing protein n=1 Tax=Trichuris suis TaxID=68888 RepID=A0A085MRY4_9BILA|nr:hypothetical protein M514_27828 [Trichuris suis]
MQSSKHEHSWRATVCVLTLPGVGFPELAPALVGPERLPEVLSVATSVHGKDRSPTLTDQGASPDHPLRLSMSDSNKEILNNDPERTAGGEEATLVAVQYPGPFRCTACETAFDIAHKFVEHARLHHIVVSFSCSLCGRTYPTIAGVSCHHSRCRKKAPQTEAVQMHEASEDAPEKVCPDCRRVFKSFAGVQLHRRSAHPSEFQASKPLQKKPRWERFEMERLAELEASLVEVPRNINQVLQELLLKRYGIKRTVDMMKGRRRLQAHQARILQIRTDQQSTSEDHGTRNASVSDDHSHASNYEMAVATSDLSQQLLKDFLLRLVENENEPINALEQSLR